MASRGLKPMPRGKPSGLPFHAHFTDIAEQAGLREPVIYGPADRFDYILESIGCGVAFLDYDNDGWLDIFVLSGTRRDGSTPRATNRLYKNNRDGTFTDVTKHAGLTRNGWASGVTVGDYDNDGWDDLFISYWGENVLYRNNHDGTFADVTKQAGLLTGQTRWSTGCTWVDYDRDGKLDLFISHYVDFDFEKIPATGKDDNCRFKGVPVNCGPRGLKSERCSLYHNNGDGTFTDVTAKSRLASIAPGFGLTAVAADFHANGWPDIYVASDSTPSLYLSNLRDGTFAEQGLQQGLAVNEDGSTQAGMGVGIGDFDTDGRLDIIKTHFTEDTVALFANRGDVGFEEVTNRAGLGVETRYVNWGVGIADFDNNGLPDLFWVTGSVFPEVEKIHPEFPHKTPRVLFRNLGGGKFEELMDMAGPAVSAAHCSRGLAFGDFDNDGDVDMVIVNLNEPPSLLRNDVSGGGHWLKVLLEGVKSNRSAIGATVIATYGSRKQAQAVLAQSSFLSASDRRLHFGLGAETAADLEILWPSGVRESIKGVLAGRLVRIREGSGILKSEVFGEAGRGA